ncbi:putative No apical meristem-associated domain-containing protein [Helianthus anomalus]
MGRGEYRTPDLFSGKWTAMRTKINNFNNIYHSLINNHTRRSGSSDVDIMTTAHNEYRMYHGHPFTMIPSWKLLCKSPKWHLEPSFNSMTHRSKRSKSTTTREPSEFDAHTTNNLNDDLDELHFEEPQELPRPKGRDRSKAAA